MLFNDLSWSCLFLDEDSNILNFALKLICDQDCSDMKVDRYSENCQVQLEPDIILQLRSQQAISKVAPASVSKRGQIMMTYFV